MAQPAPSKTIDFPVANGSPRGVKSAADRLDSWKEIAAHLRRGTRTLQRWEREQGLPVHRLRHEQGSTVYAYRSELDAWMARQQTATGKDSGPAQDPGPSIAVLPFADISREKDQEYFCEGIAEEILNALARLQGLRVASRISSFQCRNVSGGSREIGRRLRVRTLLEGSVRKAENHLRITAQLTDAETGYQVWTATYDRELSDVFSVQEEIAHHIVRKLEVTLSAEENGTLHQAPTRHFEAYDCYLRGRRFFYHYNRRDVEFANRLFARAVQLDPAFALAHAGLADGWSYLYMYAERTKEALRQADEASLRAVELDPFSAQAQASRGLALSLGGRDQDAERAFESALRLDPGLFEAHYFYARHRFARGEIERAVGLYEKAMGVRPEDYQSPLLVAQSYEVLGRPEQARAARQRGIHLAEEQLAANPDDTRAMYMAANGLVSLGEFERGLAWVERALERQPEEAMLLYNAGCVYALAGRLEQALDVLERAVNHGLSQRGWFVNDGNLDPLRPLPRFQTLLQRLYP